MDILQVWLETGSKRQIARDYRHYKFPTYQWYHAHYWLLEPNTISIKGPQVRHQGSLSICVISTQSSLLVVCGLKGLVETSMYIRMPYFILIPNSLRLQTAKKIAFFSQQLQSMYSSKYRFTVNALCMLAENKIYHSSKNSTHITNAELATISKFGFLVYQ